MVTITFDPIESNKTEQQAQHGTAPSTHPAHSDISGRLISLETYTIKTLIDLMAGFIETNHGQVKIG